MRGMRSFCSYCDIMALKFPFYLKSGPAGPQGMPGEAGKWFISWTRLFAQAASSFIIWISQFRVLTGFQFTLLDRDFYSLLSYEMVILHSLSRNPLFREELTGFDAFIDRKITVRCHALKTLYFKINVNDTEFISSRITTPKLEEEANQMTNVSI